MSLKIGITGGIGSGKSYVAQIFKALGVPFYDADKEAKAIMTRSASLRTAIIEAFGAAAYFPDGSLNKSYLAEHAFKDEESTKRLNALVHPAVIQDALDWSNQQTSAYSLKEAALLFESGSYKTLDYTLLVVAPLDLRIQRVRARDQATEEQVRARIDKQMPDAEKEKLADFIIVNDGVQALLPQVLHIHNTLIKA